MSRDPFDEFRKIFRKMMKGDNMLMGGSGYSISVQKVGDKTKVKVRGEVPEGEIKKLRRKYPDSDIIVNGEKVSGSRSVEVLDDEVDEETGDIDKSESTEVEILDDEEVEPEELALRRFEEKKKE